MKMFLRLYRWAMQMKLRMAMYTFVTVFLLAVWSLVQGGTALAIKDLLSAWLVSLAFAMAESWILPQDKDATAIRSAGWLLTGNLCFIGGAILFQWFAGIPAWGTVLLIVLLEMVLGLMWFGDRVVLRADSMQLTKDLASYQQRATQK